MAAKPDSKLKGETIAILAADGVEETELMTPWVRLHQAGARPQVVSLARGTVRAQQDGRASRHIAVDADVHAMSFERYDGLVIPGGAEHADRLRADAEMVRFIQDSFRRRKPVAAFREGLSLVMEAEHLYGRKLSTPEFLIDDVQFAGAHCVDREVMIDGNLITARQRDKLDNFTLRIVSELVRDRKRRRQRRLSEMIRPMLKHLLPARSRLRAF